MKYINCTNQWWGDSAGGVDSGGGHGVGNCGVIVHGGGGGGISGITSS